MLWHLDAVFLISQNLYDNKFGKMSKPELRQILLLSSTCDIKQSWDYKDHHWFEGSQFLCLNIKETDKRKENKIDMQLGNINLLLLSSTRDFQNILISASRGNSFQQNIPFITVFPWLLNGTFLVPPSENCVSGHWNSECCSLFAKTVAKFSRAIIFIGRWVCLESVLNCGVFKTSALTNLRLYARIAALLQLISSSVEQWWS